MLKKMITAFLLMGIFIFSSCSSQQPKPNREKIKVLCTTQMIADAVKEIALDKIEIDILIQGEVDPHSYQLVKGDADRIKEAAIVFSNGLNLEHGASLKQALASHSFCVSLGDQVYEKNPEKILKVDGELDPHIWMDITIWKEILEPIEKALSQIMPDQKDLFSSNLVLTQQKWLDLDLEIFQKMQSISPEKRYLVTSHDAFNYYSRRYLATDQERKDNTWTSRFKAPEGLSPDGQIGPYDIKKILDHLSSHKIAVVFPESNVSLDSLKKIISVAKAEGVKVVFAKEALFGDSMSGDQMSVSCYEDMMRHNSDVIANYLNTYHPTS
jgi:manganese/zinc/iron transport system substrate-binding protein